jgi:hypothetical protein
MTAKASFDPVKYSGDDTSELQNPLLKVDELSSVALGFKEFSLNFDQKKSSFNPEISIRYTNQDLLKIFKTMGNF